MRLATVPVVLQSFIRGSNSGSNSMSQSFHQGIFSFSDGFDRPASTEQEQHHVAQQSRRDKLRVQGFGPSASGHALVGIEADGEVDEGAGVYEPAAGATNMLSEMFNFPTAATPGPMPSELLANQIQGAYRLPSRPAGPMVGFGGDWYGNRQGGIMLGGSSSNNLSSIGEAKQINAESAAAMQLFLMNPQQQQRSPSPPPPTLHRHHQQAFQAGDGPFGTHHEASFGGGLVDTQGLSLSLSSSLQQFEIAKTDQELRVRDGLLYFNHSGGNNQNPQQQLQDHRGQQSQGQGQGQHIHMGYGPVGVNLLRNSKYARAAQELLEEFCSVGRGQFKGNRIGKHHASSSSNPNPNAAGASPSVAGSSSSSKEPPPLSPADRFEHQRKKSKLLSMLDEVDRRYNHYCDQMQMVVTSFDSVMGYGAATPYTALAQKAMSRHFRCLKDAIAAQLKRTCEALGEKEGGSGSGITKGETPRLRLLDQSLRQQRAFHQMGMMEQEAWRPQRGLPERSVNILRAWLFEHFLHPYPTDADKHLLARQTGLSRNQVSNWFINARVRLWKPMVEEMYQHESKDETDDSQREDGSQYQRSGSPTQQQQQQQQGQQQQQQRRGGGHKAETETTVDSDPTPTLLSSRHRRFPSDQNPHLAHHHLAAGSGSAGIGGDIVVENSTDILQPVIDATVICGAHDDLYHEYGTAAAGMGPAGDVSLTLGLRHAGTGQEKNRFTVRDYGGC